MSPAVFAGGIAVPLGELRRFGVYDPLHECEPAALGCLSGCETSKD